VADRGTTHQRYTGRTPDHYLSSGDISTFLVGACQEDTDHSLRIRFSQAARSDESTNLN
jgi:hypothetical protein